MSSWSSLVPTGPFTPRSGVSLDQAFNPLEAEHGLLGSISEPLAERRCLRGHVVGASHHHRATVAFGPSDQPGQQRNQIISDHEQGLSNLQLLDVFGEVARRHSSVNVLVPGGAHRTRRYGLSRRDG